MKLNKTISILAVIVLIFNIVFPTLTFALEEGKAEVKVVTSATEVKRGDEITVTAKLNTNSVDSITALTVRVKYDPNVLEPIGETTRELPTQKDEMGGVELDTDLNRFSLVWSTVGGYLSYNGNLVSQKFEVKENISQRKMATKIYFSPFLFFSSTFCFAFTLASIFLLSSVNFFNSSSGATASSLPALTASSYHFMASL